MSSSAHDQMMAYRAKCETIRDVLEKFYKEIQQDISDNIEHYISGDMKGMWSIPDEIKENEGIIERFLLTLDVFWVNKSSPIEFIFHYNQLTSSVRLRVKTYIEHPDYHQSFDDFWERMGMDE